MFIYFVIILFLSNWRGFGSELVESGGDVSNNLCYYLNDVLRKTNSKEFSVKITFSNLHELKLRLS